MRETHRKDRHAGIGSSSPSCMSHGRTMAVNGNRQIMFLSHLNRAMNYTHDFCRWNDNFATQQSCSQKPVEVQYKTVNMGPICNLKDYTEIRFGSLFMTFQLLLTQQQKLFTVRTLQLSLALKLKSQFFVTVYSSADMLSSFTFEMIISAYTKTESSAAYGA